MAKGMLVGLLVVSALVFRAGSAVAPAEWQLAGMAPMAALGLTAAWMLGSRMGALAMIAAVLVSDLFLNLAVYKVDALGPYGLGLAVFYGLLYLAGLRILGNSDGIRRIGRYLAGTVGGVIAFHALANTAAWMLEPGYAKSVAGWWQAQTVGLPGFLPSWAFLLRGMAGNLAFAGLFLALGVSWQAPATQSRRLAIPGS